MRKCEICDHLLDDEKKWCLVCGRKVNWGEAVTPDATEQPVKETKEEVKQEIPTSQVVTKKVEPAVSTFKPSIKLNKLKPGSLYNNNVLVFCSTCQGLSKTYAGKCIKCSSSIELNYDVYSFYRVFNMSNREGIYHLSMNGYNVIDLKPNEFCIISYKAKKVKFEVQSDYGKAFVYTAAHQGEMRHILITDKKFFSKYDISINDVDSNDLDNKFATYNYAYHAFMKDKYIEPYHYYPPYVDGLD